MERTVPGISLFWKSNDHKVLSAQRLSLSPTSYTRMYKIFFIILLGRIVPRISSVHLLVICDVRRVALVWGRGRTQWTIFPQNTSIKLMIFACSLNETGTLAKWLWIWTDWRLKPTKPLEFFWPKTTTNSLPCWYNENLFDSPFSLTVLNGSKLLDITRSQSW